MSYIMTVKENEVFGKNKYANDKGNTECAYFVQQVTGAPETAKWKKGAYVLDAKPGDIKKYTAIATFDAQGKYPNDQLGKHAAIYLSHDQNGISVLDQWNAQGEVKVRTIRANRPKGTKRSNDAATFYVID
jgi:hypothetical protein